MVETQTRSGPNLLSLFLVIVAFVVVTVYATISLAAEDWAWFLQGFDQTPDRVIVYHTGQKTEYGQGDPGYDQLAEAVRQSLDSGVARQSGIGMGEPTLNDAYGKYLTVEAFFYTPAKLHAWFNTYRPTRMLIPITGRHSELSVVLLGVEGKYMSNGPVLKDLSPLRNALRELGYLN